MRRRNVIALAVVLLLCGCFYALQGSGDYEYEVYSDDPDSTYTPPADSPPADSTDEVLDDDFDLLDNGD